MYRGSVSTFADLSVAFGAAPCHVQRVHFWHLKSAYFLETRVGASLVRGPWLPPRGCYVMCDVAVRSQIRTTRFKRVFEWGVKQAPREWSFLAGLVFGPFILSDVLKLCRLPCAQNLKLEATLTQAASTAEILNWGGPYLRL